MYCYCANYYGAINCHNKVSQFGDRCKLCTIMNEGTSANYEMLRIISNDEFAHNRGYSERDSYSREERRGRGRDRNSVIRRA